jgi:hypothetical protein
LKSLRANAATPASFSSSGKAERCFSAMAVNSPAAFLRLDFLLLVAIRRASPKADYTRVTNITIFNYTDSYFEFVVFGLYLQTNGEFLV